MGVRLDVHQAWDLVDTSHTGILTTLKADGAPVTLPVWFVVLDRAICFATPSHTKKVSRIRNDPRASFLVESGECWAELRGVHMSGVLKDVLDEATKARIDAAINDKYEALRTAKSEMAEGTRAYYATLAYFRLRPEGRILSWDNSRIATH